MNDSKQSEWDEAPKCWERVIYNTKIQVCGVLLMCGMIGIGTPILWQLIWKVEDCNCGIETDLRYDCLPNIARDLQNETDCDLSSCCWDPANYTLTDNQTIRCFFGIEPKKKISGYKIINSTRKNGSLVSAELGVEADSIPYYLSGSNGTRTDIKIQVKLHIEVKHYGDNHARFTIKTNSVNGKRFDPSEPKDYLQFNPLKETDKSNFEMSWPEEIDSKFHIKVKRKDTRQVIFNTIHSPLIFSDHYIELTTLLPNDLAYGLGQSPTHNFKHNLTYPQRWGLFSKEHLNLTMNNKNWYGAHPFYLGLDDDDGTAYGVLLVNTHPIEVVTNSRPSLTFRALGGQFDFHFFYGPTPLQVIQQLTDYVGRPTLPPYWALGFHLCRTTIHFHKVSYILKEAERLKIPIESDCVNSFLAFSSFVDENRIAEDINGTIETRQGKRSMFVNVPQIKKYSSLYNDSIREKIFILKSDDQPYEGSVKFKDMDTKVVYPDFHQNDQKQIEHHISKILQDFQLFKPNKIEGMILDWNTPFDHNRLENEDEDMKKACDNTSVWNNVFVSPGEKSINENTICMDSVYPHNKKKELRHLSLHNLYGYQHSNMIKKGLEESDPGKNRKLVLSLSTFIGNGKFGGYWGGRIPATWALMRQTILQTLDFSMYGIPLSGFPVCGFNETMIDEELCLRWYQIAAFQPLMISHTGLNQNLTDPISINDPLYESKTETPTTSTFRSIKSVLNTRYRLLPYLYTLFKKCSITGEPVLRSLFMEFPKEVKTHRVNYQFLWGSALLISPVVHSGKNSIDAYFPEGFWYDFYSGKRILGKKGYRELSTVENVNLHLRGGFVVPTQKGGLNTDESRNNTFTMIAALNEGKEAKGELFIDDGIELYNPSETHLHSHINVNIYVNSTFVLISSSSSKFEYHLRDKKINTILDVTEIYGIIEPPLDNRVIINSKGKVSRTPKVFYNQEYGVLSLKNLNIDLADLAIGPTSIAWNTKFPTDRR